MHTMKQANTSVAVEICHDTTKLFALQSFS